MSLILWLACTGGGTAQAYRTAVDPETSLSAGVQLCEETGEQAEECTATVVRNHLDSVVTDGDDLIRSCGTLSSDRWRSECFFSIAEAFAKAGDRGSALLGCGRAGAYYDECLYHAWTFELQEAAKDLKRAVDGVEKAREIIEYWRQIETIGGDPEALLWNDWYFFAHTRNKPARVSDCGLLSSTIDVERCEAGTRLYVTRTVTETLIRPNTAADTRDRMCRSEDVSSLFPEAWVADPTLDAAAREGRDRGCAGGKVERPWNPIFRARP